MIAIKEWLHTGELRQEVRLDEYVIMPDHLHAILFIDEIQPGEGTTPDRAVGAHGRAHLQRKPHSLGAIVAGYKSTVTKKVNELQGTPRQKLWQRNYHDRVIRNQVELDRIREYIHYNPHILASRNLFDELK